MDPKICSYPNQTLRSGIFGGGLTSGELDRETSCCRVYFLIGRGEVRGFWGCCSWLSVLGGVSEGGCWVDSGESAV